MAKKPIIVLEEYFGQLEDPRIERRKLHKLLDIIVIAICGVICGADNWVDIQHFGERKKAWLEQFLELANGIPSHDTFGRVFSRLNAEQFQACFLEWVKAVNQITKGQVIAIDGKQVRRSMDSYQGKGAIYMVSAWAEENRLVLGQRKVAQKSNEITAIPELLDLLEVTGCVLDLSFDEDHNRARKDHAPANLTVVRHIAVNLLRQEKTVKGGIQAKRLQAAWDESYLLQVLSST